MGKLLISFLVVLSFWTFSFAQENEGWKFGLSEKMEIIDSQKTLLPFEKSVEALAGTGLCYGPFFSTSYNQRWLADFISICSLAAVSKTGEAAGTGGVDLINALGLQAGVQIDFSTRKPFYSFGISLTRLGKQLLK